MTNAIFEMQDYYDVVESLVQQLNQHAEEIPGAITLTIEQALPILKEEVTEEELLYHLESDFGRGFVMGYVLQRLQEMSVDDDVQA